MNTYQIKLRLTSPGHHILGGASSLSSSYSSSTTFAFISTKTQTNMPNLAAHFPSISLDRCPLRDDIYLGIGLDFGFELEGEFGIGGGNMVLRARIDEVGLIWDCFKAVAFLAGVRILARVEAIDFVGEDRGVSSESSDRLSPWP